MRHYTECRWAQVPKVQWLTPVSEDGEALLSANLPGHHPIPLTESHDEILECLEEYLKTIEMHSIQTTTSEYLLMGFRQEGSRWVEHVRTFVLPDYWTPGEGFLFAEGPHHWSSKEKVKDVQLFVRDTPSIMKISTLDALWEHLIAGKQLCRKELAQTILQLSILDIDLCVEILAKITLRSAIVGVAHAFATAFYDAIERRLVVNEKAKGKKGKSPSARALKKIENDRSSVQWTYHLFGRIRQMWAIWCQEGENNFRLWLKLAKIGLLADPQKALVMAPPREEIETIVAAKDVVVARELFRLLYDSENSSIFDPGGSSPVKPGRRIFRESNFTESLKMPKIPVIWVDSADRLLEEDWVRNDAQNTIAQASCHDDEGAASMANIGGESPKSTSSTAGRSTQSIVRRRGSFGIKKIQVGLDAEWVGESIMEILQLALINKVFIIDIRTIIKKGDRIKEVAAWFRYLFANCDVCGFGIREDCRRLLLAMAGQAGTTSTICCPIADLDAHSWRIRELKLRFSPHFGLSQACEQVLGKGLDKSLQRSDWSRRPLESEQIEYASLDALCLLWILEKKMDICIIRPALPGLVAAWGVASRLLGTLCLCPEPGGREMNTNFEDHEKNCAIEESELEAHIDDNASREGIDGKKSMDNEEGHEEGVPVIACKTIAFSHRVLAVMRLDKLCDVSLLSSAVGISSDSPRPRSSMRSSSSRSKVGRKEEDEESPSPPPRDGKRKQKGGENGVIVCSPTYGGIFEVAEGINKWGDSKGKCEGTSMMSAPPTFPLPTTGRPVCDAGMEMEVLAGDCGYDECNPISLRAGGSGGEDENGGDFPYKPAEESGVVEHRGTSQQLTLTSLADYNVERGALGPFCVHKDGPSIIVLDQGLEARCRPNGVLLVGAGERGWNFRVPFKELAKHGIVAPISA